MKIIAAILLIIGVGLSSSGAYGYFFSADYERCQRYNSIAQEKLKEARAALGTPRGAEMMEEARLEVDSAARACRNAKRTHQWTVSVGLGGLTAIFASLVLLFISRKKGTITE